MPVEELLAWNSIATRPAVSAIACRALSDKYSVDDKVITEPAVFTLKRGDPTGLTIIELADGVALDEVRAKANAIIQIGLI